MVLNGSNETNVNITTDENLGTGQSITFSELDSQTTNPRLSDIPKSKEPEIETSPEPEVQEAPSEQKIPESPKSGKKVTFNDGIQNGELSADIKLKHKVDGKEVEWTLLELLNDKSGQTAWDKKFQELSLEKNSFKKEREIVERYISGFQEAAKKGDAMGALEYLVHAAGISPLEFKKSLRNQVMPDFEKWQQLSEEQRKFKELEEENNYFKNQRESESQKVKDQESQKELNSKLKVAQEAHGFSDKDLVEAYDVLAEHYKPEQVNLDLITSYMKERNAVNKAEELIGKVDTELNQNEKVLDSITDLVLSGRHSDEELVEIIQGSFAKKSSKKKSESKSSPAIVDKKIEINNNIKQALSFADLD